jgi:hypothetical protein
MLSARSALLALLLPLACRVGPEAPVGLTSNPSRLRYELTVDGRALTLDLTRNTSLVSPDFRGQRFDGASVIDEPVDRDELTRCLYSGAAHWADSPGGPAGLVAVNACEGLRGLVSLDGRSWSVDHGVDLAEVMVQSVAQHPLDAPRRAMVRRLPLAVTGVTEAALTVPTRYLELSLFSDTTFFTAHGTATRASALELANIADTLYRGGSLTPSMAIVVKSHLSFTTTMPFTWTTQANGEALSTSLLNSFSAWVGQNVAPAGQVVAGDDYFLLTGLDFNGATVGLADVGAACRVPNGGGISQSTFSTAYNGVTVAHELGHTVGMQHDTGATGTACDSSAYIMAAIACTNCPTTPGTFSSCSQASFTSWLSTSQPTCLDNVPTTALVPRCGDGIVQAGERCDCGDSNCTVNDPCCDGATCQLVAGATCATNGGCCNQCQLAAPGHSCRASTNAACDLGGACNGIDDACPPSTLPMGTACNDGNAATGGKCYQGKCVSYLAECQGLPALGFPLMGMTTCNSQASFNSGNFCGVLWCGTNNSMTNCTSSTLLSGAQVMMSDGASCGATSQCVGQACVATSTLTPPAVLAFQAGPWGPCSKACAGGTQSRVVSCEDQLGRYFPDSACPATKPVTSQACNTGPCPVYAWAPGAFGACSVLCGGGTQQRAVPCVEQNSMLVVADSLCTGTRPALQQACNPSACSYVWATGAFGACSVACGAGTQTRTVTCLDQASNATVADAMCPTPKPDPQGTCTGADCVDAGTGGTGKGSGCGCGAAPSSELVLALLVLLARRLKSGA